MPTPNELPLAVTMTLDDTVIINVGGALYRITVADLITENFGSMAYQDSDDVSITGGIITDIQDIALADGGTGASTAAGARTNLGLGDLAVLDKILVTDVDSGAAPALYALVSNGDGTASWQADGGGTVGSVSVATANGFSGTVSNPTTTPEITINAANLDVTKLADGSISNTEFQYLNNVSSNIQTQLDGKQATGNYITALTGDGTASGPGSVALTLATVNSNVGTFGSAANVGSFAVNAKGLITSASNIAIAIASTQVTDFVEAAQDAIGGMVDSTLVYVDGTPSLGRAAISGDVVIAAGSNTAAIGTGVIVDADINASAAIDATKIADGSVTNTEFQFINTLSSNAQTQLDGKQTSIQWKDEGSNIGTAGQPVNIDFVGSGVTAAYSSGTVTVTIPGGGGGSSAFNDITSGTNTTAAMIVGTGASLTTSGSGNIAATSVPLSGVSGLGTGVATALAVNVGTAGAPVVNGGALGTPSSGVATNLTGTAAGLTAGTVTTNANLTGPITSVGNATSIASQTGTGSTFVMQSSPTLTTPNIGVATGTSLDVSGVLESGANGGTQGQLTLLGSTSGSAVIKTAAAAGTGTIFQLPADNGTNNYVLKTDGAGVTSWVAPSSGGSPGGSTTQVQFNNAGAFGGDAGFTFDSTGPKLLILGEAGVSDSEIFMDSLDTGAYLDISTVDGDPYVYLQSSDANTFVGIEADGVDGTAEVYLYNSSFGSIKSVVNPGAGEGAPYFGIYDSTDFPRLLLVGATNSNASYLSFFEGITNGTNRLSLNGPASISSDKAQTFQDLAGSVAVGALGGSTSTAQAVTKASLNVTAVGNVGTGTDDLITYSLPANALDSDGRAIRIRAWGTKANNANAKTLTLNFGSTVIATRALGTNAAAGWQIEAIVTRTGSNTQDYAILTFTDNVTLSTPAVGTSTQTDSAAITIKCTGTATSNNDIVQEGLLVEMLN